MDDQFAPLFPTMSTTTGTPVGEPAFVGVRIEGSPEQPAPKADPQHEPFVTLRKEGNRVTQIEILCSCGQRLVFDCEY